MINPSLKSKKGVSPLIATVLLILIVVSIGAAVMLAIRGIFEKNLEETEEQNVEFSCGTDIAIAPIKIGKFDQVCLNNSQPGGGKPDKQGGQVILQNKGSEDIIDFKLTVIGDNVYEDNSLGVSLLAKETKKIIFEYYRNETGPVRQFQLIPIISGRTGSSNVACIDRAFEVLISNVKSPCPLP